jgi:hypothetical protein
MILSRHDAGFSLIASSEASPPETVLHSTLVLSIHCDDEIAQTRLRIPSSESD